MGVGTSLVSSLRFIFECWWLIDSGDLVEDIEFLSESIFKFLAEADSIFWR